MILQKDIGGNLQYLLDCDSPPSALTYSVMDSRDAVRQTGIIEALPVLYQVSVTTIQDDGLDIRLDLDLEGEGEDEIELAFKPGDLARVTDSEGRVHDLVCSGRGAAHVLVSGLTLGPEESCVSVWRPEIEIPISAATCDLCADGYRLMISVDAMRDVVTFAVAPYTLLVPLNVRTFLDWHPEFGANQAALIRRRDWPRLVKSAIQLLETKRKASGNWLQLVAPSYGLQRAAAEALYYLVGEEIRPKDWAGAPGDYERARERRLTAAIKDLLANSKIDDDADGKIASKQPESREGAWRIVL
jgi:hypothetical protein